MSGPEHGGGLAIGNPGPWLGARRLRREIHKQRQILFAVAIKLAAAAATFVVTVLIARNYGAAVSGEFALFALTATTFATIAVFGNEYLLIRRMAGALAQGRFDLARFSYTYARKWVALAGIALGALLLAVSPWAEAVGVTQPIIAIAGIALVFHALLQIGAAAVRGTHRLVESQWLLSVQPIIMLVLTLGVVTLWDGRPGLGLALGYTAALVVAAGLAALAAYRITKGWPRSDRTHPDEGKTNSAKLGLTVILDFAMGWCALSLTGALLGAAEMGVFRVCLQFITVVAMIGATLDGLMGPRLAASFSLGNLAAARKTLNRSIVFLLVSGGPLLLLMIIFAEPLLGVMGDEFRAGAAALGILALGQLAALAAGAAGTALNMNAREDISLALALASFVIVIPALLWLTPRFGIGGPAIAIALAWVIRYQGSHVYARLMMREAR